MTNREDEFQRAYAAALRLLSLCDRSKKDLKDRLLKKGYPAEMVERVLSQLESTGYIDDERFALKFAMAAVKRKNAGPEAIRYGLQQKGVQRGIIEETVNKVFQDNEEKEVALKALSRRLKSPLYKRGDGGIASQRDEIKKLSDYLRRKGFSYDIIRKTLEEIEKEDDDI